MRPQSSSPGIKFTAIAAIALVMLGALLQRLPGWQPASLWLDDQWVGVLAAIAPVEYLLTGDYPFPPGLILLMRAVVLVAGKGEWQLQAIPFFSALAVIPLLGWITARATGSWILGAIAAILCGGNGLLSLFGLRVKPFAFDAFVSVLLMALAIRYIDHKSVTRFAALALAAAVAPLFSWPSLIFGSILVGVLCLDSLAGGDESAPRNAKITWACVYGAVALGIYLSTMRGRGAATLYTWWDPYYLPIGDAKAAIGFMATAGADFFSRAFPTQLPWLAIAVPFGLIVLMLDKQLRVLSVTIALVYVALFVVSALRLYPVGGGRTDIFSFPLTIFAAVVALMPLQYLSRPDWFRGVARLIAPVTAMLLMIAFIYQLPMTAYRYPASGGAQVVARAAEILRPEDALIVFTWTNWAVGFYGPWPVRIEPADDSTNAYYARPIRAHTLVPDERWGGIRINQDRAAVREQLLPFLRTSPGRLVYLIDTGPNEANQWFVESILASGYRLDRAEDPGGAILMVFER